MSILNVLTGKSRCGHLLMFFYFYILVWAFVNDFLFYILLHEKIILGHFLDIRLIYKARKNPVLLILTLGSFVNHFVPSVISQ